MTVGQPAYILRRPHGPPEDNRFDSLVVPSSDLVERWTPDDTRRPPASPVESVDEDRLFGVDDVDQYGRRRGTGGPAPILMLTAQDSAEERDLGLTAGADDYLHKLFDFDELIARVEELIQR